MNEAQVAIGPIARTASERQVQAAAVIRPPDLTGAFSLKQPVATGFLCLQLADRCWKGNPSERKL